MEKKPKLKLDDIKVESFITSMDENMSNKIKGMGCPVGTDLSKSPTYCENCNTYGYHTCLATCDCSTTPICLA